jgi:hypothetical protein
MIYLNPVAESLEKGSANTFITMGVIVFAGFR